MQVIGGAKTKLILAFQ